MNKDLGTFGAVLALAGMGYAGYVQDKAEAEIDQRVQAEVQATMPKHAELHEQEKRLQTQVSGSIMQMCRDSLASCLDEIKLKENCEWQVHLPPHEFVNLYGNHGVNQAFSYPATLCATDAARKVNECEVQEISCLQNSIAKAISPCSK